MATLASSNKVPYLAVTIELPEKGITTNLEALVDTGFTEEVVLPSNVVANGKPALGHQTLSLADGSDITVPAYLGTIRIGKAVISPVVILVFGTEPIIGLKVIRQFRFILDHDRTLAVEL